MYNYLGGFAQPRQRAGAIAFGSPPPGPQGFFQPPPPYIGPPAIGNPPGDVRIQGGGQPLREPPWFGNANSGRYLGGYGSPGAGTSGGYMTPRAMPGAQVGTNPKFQPLGGFARPLPGIAAGEPYLTNRGTVPPIPPPQPVQTVPPAGNVAPDWLGPRQVPGESRGYYSGPPQRMGMVMDPRTGKRARGAADILASMSAGGWRPKNNPNFSFSFDQADAMKAGALADLAKSYEAGTLSDIDARMYENYLATGEWGGLAYPGMYDSDFGDPRYEATGFDAEGRDPWDRYLESMGAPRPPRVSWAFNETPTEAQLAEAEAAWNQYQAALATWEGQTYGRNRKPPGWYDPRTGPPTQPLDIGNPNDPRGWGGPSAPPPQTYRL